MAEEGEEEEEEEAELRVPVDEFSARRMLYLKQPRVFESMMDLLLCVFVHWCWLNGRRA